LVPLSSVKLTKVPVLEANSFQRRHDSTGSQIVLRYLLIFDKIRPRPQDTKTDEGRLVPLNQELLKMFKAMPRGLPGVPVFTYKGNSVSCIKKSFMTACKRAKVENFCFHDLRHTAINNWRLQGHDYFRIMAASGHKTMEVFKRYNTVTGGVKNSRRDRKTGGSDTHSDT
jgi:integrase